MSVHAVSRTPALASLLWLIPLLSSIGSPFCGTAVAAEAGAFVDPVFTDIGAGLPPIDGASASWGDYDNDGDLDILLTGRGMPSGPVLSRIYRNDAGVFVDIGAGLPGVQAGDAAWGDFDRDGDLDILLTGWVDANTRIANVYRNDDGAFLDIGAGLVGVMNSAVDWGDYDNDGDLDILLAGREGAQYYARIYRCDDGVFTDIAAGLPGVGWCSAAWGDYDGDGDLDLVLAGQTATGRLARIYRNDQGSFVSASVPPAFLAVSGSSAIWGDYDSDGDLDIFLAGLVGSYRISRVFANDGGSFSFVQDLVGVTLGAAAWGDCDNDGDFDLLLTGEDAPGSGVSMIYRNDAGWFSNMGAGLPGTQSSSVAWGDYDKDGDLDFLLAGYTGSGADLAICRIYRNDGTPPNNVPATPADLSVQVAGSDATFTWDASTDNETPSSGLTYNLRVGTTPGGSEIVSAMSDAVTGYRRVPQFGNAGHRTALTIELPAPLPAFYWSVQAVDAAFAGSLFASEEEVETGVDDWIVPRWFALHACAPNPFHPTTTIHCDLPRQADVSLTVHDVAGRQVAVLAEGSYPAGEFTRTWHGLDRDGREVEPGIYVARIQAGDFTAARKMVLIK